MLVIKNTKMLTGITVHGDYQDLNSLYDSLHKYLAFYFQNQENYDNDFYESLLGLCYGIRHAYQGDWNIESVENNAENIAMLASCIYQMDEEALTEERSNYASGNLYLLGLAYELASSELLTQYPDQFAQASANYQSALNVIKEGTQLPLYFYIDFYNLYTDFFSNSTKKVTEKSQEDFIQKYFGSVDWEYLIW